MCTLVYPGPHAGQALECCELFPVVRNWTWSPKEVFVSHHVRCITQINTGHSLLWDSRWFDDSFCVCVSLATSWYSISEILNCCQKHVTSFDVTWRMASFPSLCCSLLGAKVWTVGIGAVMARPMRPMEGNRKDGFPMVFKAHHLVTSSKDINRFQGLQLRRKRCTEKVSEVRRMTCSTKYLKTLISVNIIQKWWVLWYRYTCTSSWGTMSMQLVWSKSRKVSHEILFLASGPSTLPRKECEQCYLTSYEYQRVTGNFSIKRLQLTLLCNFHNSTGKINLCEKKKKSFSHFMYFLSCFFQATKGFSIHTWQVQVASL